MKRLMNKRLSARGEEEAVNPMDNIANLVDVMVVLAVGIMLALIMNWNLDIETLAHEKEARENSINTENALTFENENMEEIKDNTEQVDGEGMERLGTVYLDEESGTYYIVAE